MFRWDGSFLSAKMERDISWLVLTILRGLYQILKDLVHDTNKRGCTSKILRNVKKTAFTHPVLGFFVHFNVSPAEPVDALLGITHDKETFGGNLDFFPFGRLSFFILRKEKDDLCLKGVCILKFVNQ